MKNQWLFVLLLFVCFGMSCSHPKVDEQSAGIENHNPQKLKENHSKEVSQVFNPFKAHNGVELPYTVVMPTNYDRTQAYPALFVFTSLEYDMKRAHFLKDEFFTDFSNEDWIIVMAVAPKGGHHGWINHPAHHALNDLMDHVQKDHTIQNNQFHFLGFHDGGIPAATFAGMSKKYVQSLTWIASEDWSDFDEKGYDRLSDLDIPLILIVGENDKKYLSLAQQAVVAFEKRKADITLLTQAQDDEQVASLKQGVLLEKLSPYLLKK